MTSSDDDFVMDNFVMWHITCDMLHAKCYVLHVISDMFKSFIIYGETGDQELYSWVLHVTRVGS